MQSLQPRPAIHIQIADSSKSDSSGPSDSESISMSERSHAVGSSESDAESSASASPGTRASEARVQGIAHQRTCLELQAKRRPQKHSQRDKQFGNALGHQVLRGFRQVEADLRAKAEGGPAQEILVIRTGLRGYVESGEIVANRDKGEVGTLPKDVEEEIDKLIKTLKAKPAPITSALDAEAIQERRLHVIDFIGRVLRNDFESDHGRRLANVANVTLRTGLVVAMSTFAREAVAYELHKAQALGEHDTLLTALGVAAIATSAGLNLAGAIRSGCLGTATRVSQLSRLALGLLQAGTVTTCYLTGALDNLLARAPAILVYGVFRDFFNFFFPLRENIHGLSRRGVHANSAVFGVSQILVTWAMLEASPLGGAGGVPEVPPGANATMPEWQRAAEASLHVGDTAIKSLLNAIGEIADDIALPGLIRHFEVRDYRRLVRQSRQIETLRAEYDTELREFARELFKAPGSERISLIGRKNLSLYRRVAAAPAETHRLTPEVHERIAQFVRKCDATNNQTADYARNRLRKKLEQTTDDDWLAEVTLVPVLNVADARREPPADFEILDLLIDEKLQGNYTADERKAVAEAIYVEQFVQAYMPVRASRLERQLREDMLRAPDAVPPGMLEAQLRDEVERRRAEGVDGLRIRLSPVWQREDVRLVDAFARQFLTTDAARTNALEIVFGFLFATSFLLEQIEDERLRSVAASCMVGLGVFAIYAAFAFAHDSRAPRVQPPSAVGRAPHEPAEFDEGSVSALV